MTYYCSQCGAPMKPTAKFCSQCGAPAQSSSQYSGAAGFKTEPMQNKPVPVRDDRRTGGIVLLVTALLMAAAGGAFLWKKIVQSHERKTLYDSIELQYSENAQTDPVIITWYESGTVDPLSYVVSNEYTVTASPDAIDSSVLGDTTVTFTVKAETEETGIVERTFIRTFSVRDTHAPTISLVKESVAVSESDGYSVTDNIDRIWDDHDGELKYRKEKTESKGTPYYTLNTDGDPSLPGTHTVTVYAVDAAGNETTETFVLRVRKEEKNADTVWTETRIVATPAGCSVNFNDVDRLYRELDQYGNEYTSPAYSSESEMRSALKEFEDQKYPDRPCQVYPALHRERDSEQEWIFYDYDPYK